MDATPIIDDFWGGNWTLCGCGYRAHCLVHCGNAHQDGSGQCWGLQAIKVKQEWDDYGRVRVRDHTSG